jgi:hypothetical protein
MLLYGTSNMNADGTMEILINLKYFSGVFDPTPLGNVYVKRGIRQGFSTGHPTVRIPFNLDGTRHPSWLSDSVMAHTWKENLTFLLALTPEGLDIMRELRESSQYLDVRRVFVEHYRGFGSS